MTTRLEIINSMLGVNGVSPVSSESSRNPAAIIAKATLSRVDKKVQAIGWYFNKEDMTLSPNLAGEVIIPQNALSVDPVDPASQYVQRGSRLYDRENNTFVIDATVKCTVVLQLDLEDLPEQAASYIEAKAVREFYRNDAGDAQTVRDLRTDENEAYARLMADQLSAEDVNIRNSPLGATLLAETSSGRYLRKGS